MLDVIAFHDNTRAIDFTGRFGHVNPFRLKHVIERAGHALALRQFRVTVALVINHLILMAER